MTGWICRTAIVVGLAALASACASAQACPEAVPAADGAVRTVEVIKPGVTAVTITPVGAAMDGSSAEKRYIATRVDATGCADGDGTVGNGTLPMAHIMQVVSANEGDLRACYEAQLGRASTLAGKMDVMMVVDCSGQVAMATVDYSDIQNVAVERCVLDEVASWEFTPPSGGVHKMIYPIVFRVAPEPTE